MEAVRVRHIVLPAEEHAKNRDGKGWVRERGEGGKRRDSSGRQEKIDGGEASAVDFSETAVEMAARDTQMSPSILLCGFLIHGKPRGKSKAKPVVIKQTQDRRKNKPGMRLSIYTHRRRLGWPGFTRFVILHEESHAMFKNCIPVTTKPGTARSQKPRIGRRCWKHLSHRLVEDKRF